MLLYTLKIIFLLLFTQFESPSFIPFELFSFEQLLIQNWVTCLVCKIVAHELESRLEETGKKSDVIEIGYSLDDIKPKKKTEYKKS